MNANEVTLLESQAQTRSVYYSTELDQKISEGLCLAMAQVLAYVYYICQHNPAGASAPNRSRTGRTLRVCGLDR